MPPAALRQLPSCCSPDNANHAAAVRHASDQPGHRQLHEQRAGHAQRAQLKGVGAPAGAAAAAGRAPLGGLGRGKHALLAAEEPHEEVPPPLLTRRSGPALPPSHAHPSPRGGAPVAAGDAPHNGGDLQLPKCIQPQRIARSRVKNEAAAAGSESLLHMSGCGGRGRSQAALWLRSAAAGSVHAPMACHARHVRGSHCWRCCRTSQSTTRTKPGAPHPKVQPGAARQGQCFTPTRRRLCPT